MSTGLARVTISAPQRRVDVALPEHVPLAELLPEVLRHAGEGLADDGEQHGGWVLRRTDGAALATAQALLPQGVRDGEVLHLVPARAHWPELEYDDVVEAIADGARRRGAAWSPGATRAATLAGAGGAARRRAARRAAPAARRGARRPASRSASRVLLTLGRRWSPPGRTATRVAGAALGGYALPYAVRRRRAAGRLRRPGRRRSAPLRWLGAPELLAGSVALLLVAVLGRWSASPPACGSSPPGSTVGLLGALAALAGFAAAGGRGRRGADGGAGLRHRRAAAAGDPVRQAADAAGHAADRRGGARGSPAAGRARSTRPGSGRTGRRVFAAVARTEELLTGMLIGHAVLAVVRGASCW